MKPLVIFITSVLFFCSLNIFSQTTVTIKGIVVDNYSQTLLNGVKVAVKNTSFSTQTNSEGVFYLENVQLETAFLEVYLENYQPQTIPLHFAKTKVFDVGTIYLRPEKDEQQLNVIVLSDDDLQDDGNNNSTHIAGVFQSSKDAFLNAAAYNFSQSWFKIRGYDSSYGQVLINGVEMNKLYDGRPQWSNWGGLNDMFRNQESLIGIANNNYSFGNVLGVTNFSTIASAYKKGSKVSLAATNKSYTGRLMANYASGVQKNGWAYAISASRRVANEGYFDGTTYNAWAAFLSIEKIINQQHSLNLTAFYAPNKRGKSSPNTQEVYNLKGYTYNSYWGNQQGEQRNSRIKEVEEPIIMLTHTFKSNFTTIKTTGAFQFGHISNSRLGYFKALNPDPTYWKNLPSYYVRFPDNPDYANAYLATQNFINNGQINWNEIYELNHQKNNALYYLYSDYSNDTQISINTVLNTRIKNVLNATFGVDFKNLTSHNYAKMLDLLGSNGFVDIDQYAIGNAQQNNLNNPNNIVTEGDKFQYNYKINSTVTNVFGQISASLQKIEYYLGANLKATSFQRTGIFKNGRYAFNSFGKSKQQMFTNFSAKGGLTYKITGRHLVALNTAFISNAPNIKNTFANARVNNEFIPNLTNEKISTFDISYIGRLPKLQARATAYYTQFKNAVKTSFFYAEGLLGDQADFVNEITTGIHKLHLGAELSLAYQLTPAIKLLAVGSFGQYTYNNNPQLYLQSESLTNEKSDFGIAYLKNYKISGTPQKAYALGFEYRDPAYWWFQLNGSFLSENYLDISPLLRTDNFYKDADGIPFLDDETGLPVTQQQVANLLKQEKFDDAFLLDIVGGKSWYYKKKYIGFFVGINNALGKRYKTGGFEQSRNSNYPELKEDKQLEKPIFGPKYWYGNTASFYLNVYLRF
jgi:hypothetical protein